MMQARDILPTIFNMPLNNNSEWVTAKEVATYVYCAESWQLAHGLKKSPYNQTQLERGRAQHETWQKVERSTARLIRYALLFADVDGAMCHRES